MKLEVTLQNPEERTAVEAFLFALRAHSAHSNNAVVHQGWYSAHTEGVITVRRNDLVKRPLHDVPPTQK